MKGRYNHAYLGVNHEPQSVSNVALEGSNWLPSSRLEHVAEIALVSVEQT